MPASNVPISSTTRDPALDTRGTFIRVPTLLLLTCAGAALFALWPQASAGQHMLTHVLMMSAAAPLAVLALRCLLSRSWHTRPLQLWFATLLQLAVFLYWHAPAGMMQAMHGPGGMLWLQASLFAAASVFWYCIAGLGPARAWHAIAALLVTGKLFCLVAVILAFAPRPLYHMMTLADQQLAGLIMITLCPLTYIASALLLCRRWLLRFDASPP